jgi:dTDP-4-dehydrorhamnose reductase
MKKVYITGSKGLVGSRFLELLPKKYQPLTPEIDRLDITDKEKVEKFIREEKPEIIVHFAAFTDVGGAEEQRGDKKGDCWRVNVEGTRNLVEAVDSRKTHFIHISTDYVFPGNKEKPGPSPEDQSPEEDAAKLTWYGFTKAEGERIVRDKLTDATILRIIYPVRAKFEKKPDYLRKPLQLFDEGKLYPVFSDQQVSITYIDEACQALDKIMDENITGVFHACSENTSTPFELISYLLEKVRGVKNIVKPITLEEFIKTSGSSPLRYQKFGGLKVEKTEKELGIKFSTWKQIIDKLIEQGMG